MSELPGYAHVMLAGFGEEEDPAVRTTAMERGPDKLEVLNSQIKVRLSFSLYFETWDLQEDFFGWYLNEIGRIGEFDMRHPISGRPLRVSFVGGAIGRAELIDELGYDCRRAVTVEYLR
ncbi:hypothetical protein ABE488_09275 [Luteimonas sp. TWI662]|uniref:hypothetical protein n=1 Tax=Luteimonas sp. TWI662 TaxID=3136789 RepID=UPI0032095F53